MFTIALILLALTSSEPFVDSKNLLVKEIPKEIEKLLILPRVKDESKKSENRQMILLETTPLTFSSDEHKRLFVILKRIELKVKKYKTVSFEELMSKVSWGTRDEEAKSFIQSYTLGKEILKLHPLIYPGQKLLLEKDCTKWDINKCKEIVEKFKKDVFPYESLTLTLKEEESKLVADVKAQNDSETIASVEENKQLQKKINQLEQNLEKLSITAKTTEEKLLNFIEHNFFQQKIVSTSNSMTIGIQNYISEEIRFPKQFKTPPTVLVTLKSKIKTTDLDVEISAVEIGQNGFRIKCSNLPTFSNLRFDWVAIGELHDLEVISDTLNSWGFELDNQISSTGQTKHLYDQVIAAVKKAATRLEIEINSLENIEDLKLIVLRIHLKMTTDSNK